MRGLILAYHAQNCGGYEYQNNDHLALERDLRTIGDYHLPLVSLREIAVCLAAGTTAGLPERYVALSCDDGTLLDWHDYQHPRFGLQRSFANIVRHHVTQRDPGGRALLTSFVIASEAARAAIDAGCYDGAALSDAGWWSAAASEGLVAIENHSWDHVHEVLPAGLQQYGSAGDFYSIDDYLKAEQQVARAARYIDRQLVGTGHTTTLFAYPYGHASTYLAESYLPQYQAEHGVIGAFTTQQKFVDEATGPYDIPRMVCGDAWRTPAQFEQLLQQLLAV
jgi:peptidoglycan/xylan/chitin deacetylase (PgdA/CDA1 family)